MQPPQCQHSSYFGPWLEVTILMMNVQPDTTVLATDCQELWHLIVIAVTVQAQRPQCNQCFIENDLPDLLPHVSIWPRATIVAI